MRPYLSLCTRKASPALRTHDARLNSNLLGDARNAWSSHGARSTCKSKRSQECQKQATTSCFHCDYTCFFSLKPILKAHGNTPERSPHTGHSTFTFHQGPGSAGSPPGFSLYPLENRVHASERLVGLSPYRLCRHHSPGNPWSPLGPLGPLSPTVPEGPVLPMNPCSPLGPAMKMEKSGPMYRRGSVVFCLLCSPLHMTLLPFSPGRPTTPGWPWGPGSPTHPFCPGNPAVPALPSSPLIPGSASDPGGPGGPR